MIPGHGAGRRPELYRDYVADPSIRVSDAECVMGCKVLLSKEALLVGGFSGAVMLLPDRGERYLDTIFSDEWIERLR